MRSVVVTVPVSPHHLQSCRPRGKKYIPNLRHYFDCQLTLAFYPRIFFPASSMASPNSHMSIPKVIPDQKRLTTSENFFFFYKFRARKSLIQIMTSEANASTTSTTPFAQPKRYITTHNAEGKAVFSQAFDDTLTTYEIPGHEIFRSL